MSGLLTDFLFSALIGGGVAIYAALRKDTVAEYANKLGDALLNGAGKVIEKVDIPRVALPSSVTDVLAANDLKDPNDMNSSLVVRHVLRMQHNNHTTMRVGHSLTQKRVAGIVGHPGRAAAERFSAKMRAPTFLHSCSCNICFTAVFVGMQTSVTVL